MKTTIDHPRGRGALALLLPMLLWAGFLLGGCESDATAPQDPDPTLSERDAATQAGAVAMAVAQVGPEVAGYAGSAKNVYSRTYAGDITGTIWLDFRLGGASGTPATYDAADWARLYTAVGESLVIVIDLDGPGGLDPGSVQLTFDTTADVNQGLDSAVLGGGGTFRSGLHQATFAFTALTVTAAGDYPTGGSMTFTGGGFAMTVAFNGTNLATVTVTGHGTWSLNLDTGEVTPIT